MAKKEKPELSNSKLALIWIPIVCALIGLVGGLFAVFYEKPKTFLPNPLLDQAEVDLVDEKYPEAIKEAEEAKNVEEDNPRIYLVIYAAQELSGHHEEAVQALREGTKHVKKRATGGKEIRAVLKAAETSPEDGLATVVECYRSFGSKEPGLKRLALRLLQVLVRMFEGVERFVRALAEVTEEIRLAQHTATEAGGASVTGAPASEGTSTADQIKKDIDELEDMPVSAEEYAQVKAFLEEPITSLGDLVSRFAMDNEKISRGWYNIAYAENPDAMSYEEWRRIWNSTESWNEQSVQKWIEVDSIKKLSSNGSKTISCHL